MDIFIDQIIERIASEVANKININTQPENKKDYPRMNLTQSAEYCGVSITTFGRWRKQYPELQRLAYQVGGTVLYKKEDLDDFLESRRK